MSVEFHSTTTGASTRPSLLLALRVAGMRLRFPLILVVAFLVVGRWDVLRNYWDAITRVATGERANPAISSDTEYFCPMDPGIVSIWPAKLLNAPKRPCNNKSGSPSPTSMNLNFSSCLISYCIS